MISLEQCAALAGLTAKELAAGGSSTDTPRSLYDSYLLHLGKGACAVREMIVSDIRLSSELGAVKQVADMAAVLRAFLSEHPDARPTQPPDADASRASEPPPPLLGATP